MTPQRTRPTAAGRLALPALALALLAWPAPAARADNIDRALLVKAPEIMRYLKDHEYKNVGVLRFKLKRGNAKATYNGGMINSNMAARLENALVAENDPKNPMGLIHDASAVAAAKAPGKHWDDANPTDRKSLFGYTYPLAWGDDKVKVKPDAFLIGAVKLSTDMKSTTIFIDCFDPKSKDVEEVCKIENVPNDRTILADAGQSYVLSRSLVKKRSAEVDRKTGKNKYGRTLDEQLNQDAADSAKSRDDQKGGSAGNDYLEFEVFYGDDAQSVKGDPADGGELRIDPPQVGQKVSFRCKNKTSDKIGLVLFVNGKSTLQNQTDAPDDCRRWVLPADGKDRWIQGFTDEDDNERPLKVVAPGDAALKNELAEKLGLIEVVVFLSSAEPVNKDPNDFLVSRGVNLRSLSPVVRKRSGLPAAKPKNAAEARARVFKSMGLKVPSSDLKGRDIEGGFIVADPDLIEKRYHEQTDLPNPTQIATPIVIRYNDKP
ncbi:MAG TPA: hypothetical protein VFW33_18755 [Gemmataceae bacterium]|nr:hypothetical protein [Gemmataceae bacterium]